MASRSNCVDIKYEMFEHFNFLFQLVDYSDEETLRRLIQCLCERDTKRQTLLIDFEAKGMFYIIMCGR